MAGDWVKIEYTTPEKPEVYAVANALGITQAEAFLACFRIWRWFDANTTDGYARSVTERDTDAFAGCSGVTQALIKEGWMIEANGGLQIPHFNYHMSESAKKRAQSQKRMQSLRSKRNKSDAPSVTQASPEKRREEKSIHLPLTPSRGQPLTPSGNSVCAYCGVRQDQVPWAFDWDHFIPTVAGGTDDPENLLLACHVCNQIKQKRLFATVDAARQHIHWKLWTSNRKRYEQPRQFCFGGRRPSGVPPLTVSNAELPFSQRPENQNL